MPWSVWEDAQTLGGGGLDHPRVFLVMGRGRSLGEGSRTPPPSRLSPSRATSLLAQEKPWPRVSSLFPPPGPMPPPAPCPRSFPTDRCLGLPQQLPKAMLMASFLLNLPNDSAVSQFFPFMLLLKTSVIFEILTTPNINPNSAHIMVFLHC